MQQIYRERTLTDEETLARLQTALAAAGTGAWEIDPVHRTLTADGRCGALLACGAGTAMPYDLAFAAVHEAGRASLETALAEASGSDCSGRIVLSLRVRSGADGGLRRVMLQGAAVAGPDTHPLIAGIILDTTITTGAPAEAFPMAGMAEAAMNNSLVGLFRVILASNSIEYTPAFAVILTGEPAAGLSRDEFIRHIHPDDTASRQAAYEQAARTGDLHYESRTIWNDGSIHWIRTVGSYTFEPSGKPAVFTGTVQDITAERKAQESAASARRLAELAIKSSGIGVFRFDLADEDTEYSPAFAAIFTGDSGKRGLTRKDFIARIHPEDEPLRVATMRAALGGAEIYYEPRVIWNDGSVHRIRVTGACIFDDDGRPVTLSGTAKDITEQEQQANALKEAEGQLMQARRESEAMFRNVANSSPTGLWLADGDGRLTYLNKTLVDWTGQPYDALLGAGWAAAILEEDRPNAGDAFRGAVAARAHYDAMFRIRKGDGKIIWCRAAGDPYYHDDGSYAGYAGYCVDIDELVTITNELRAGETRFRSIVEQAPMAIGLLRGREMVIEVGNDRIFEIWGKDATITGMRIVDALPEIRDQGFIELLEQVFDSGVPYYGNGTMARLMRNGRLEEVYLDFSYTPLRDGRDEISGVMLLATEVTQQVRAFKAVEESEMRFRSLIEEAPFATALYAGRELIVETANEAMIRLWGKDARVLGLPLHLALPELEGQAFLRILDDVFTSGVPYHAEEAFVELMIDGALRGSYYNFTYKPLRDLKGEVYAILNMAVDVSPQVAARRKLEESELFARSVFSNSPVAKMVLAGEDLVVRAINENMLEIVGRDSGIIGEPFRTAVPEFVTAGMPERLAYVLSSGKTYYQPEERLEILKDGFTYIGYYNYIYKALRNTAGEIYGIMVTATEVTGQVLARQKAEEAEMALRGAIELAELGNWTFDVASSQFTFSDRLQSWFGFHGDETVYSTGFNPIHEDDRDYINHALARALDPATGGFYDVEYRVVNYRSGRERICHAQGKTIFDEARRPVKIMGTTQDVTEQRQIQIALERQVQERTEQLTVINEQLSRSNAQLVHSNEELAQYAYVASHDLQEPLRKIRMFSGMLESSEDLSGHNRQIVGKIAQSSERMSMLIRDLLEFSRLLKSESLFRPVDLKEVAEAVVNDFELTIAEKGARVSIVNLPVLQGIGLQMNQLFYNLLGNALKFNRPGVPPEISISARSISREEAAGHIAQPAAFAQYYEIDVADNGIGFEVKYAEQIFEVFKRLHGRDLYPGSGIGLALCRRIVDNHDGALFASSVPGEGTVFHLILPDRQEEKTIFLQHQQAWSDE